MAWALGVPVHSVTSFDLFAPDPPVAIPSKKGEWYVRQPGRPPTVEAGSDTSGCQGYGPGFKTETMPDVARVGRLMPGLEATDPFRLVPLYVAEPSISVPKKGHVLPVAER
jgi:hypothetical protein